MKCPSCGADLELPVKINTGFGGVYLMPTGPSGLKIGTEDVLQCPLCNFYAHTDYWLTQDNVPNNPYQNVPFEPRTHWIKISAKYYYDVLTGTKTFEIRKNDRGYKVGHCLVLRECVDDRFTGRALPMRIKYITDFPEGLRPGYIVMGMERI